MGPPGNRGSWGPCVLATLKLHPKKPMKGTRGISWGPLLTPGPRALPEFPNGQSTPERNHIALNALCFDVPRMY
ncbi:unnamed protein product [Staurois parvus]|uniref:Uncharacterized protein n=1 Tax=Staurois parvus TaxID=386267 RepID=A0ABN9AQ17_9NEOB|nr:unnamed protein product [Staurois parvus]